jgi:hypothetical protein
VEKIMKLRLKLGRRAASVAMVFAVVAGCDNNTDTSFVDPSASAGSGAGGSGGVDLGVDLSGAGDSGLVGSAGGEESGAGGAGCGSTKVAADPPIVNVLLVVDKSLSMSGKPSGFDSDKWTTLRGALEATFEQTQDRVSYGLELYPYSGTSGGALSGTCQMPPGDAVVVPIQAGGDAAPLILDALEDNPPDGDTPTAAALARALDYYTKGAGKALRGDKYVLLATDGGPNCNAELSCGAETCTVNMDGKCPSAVGNCCDVEGGAESCLDQDESVAGVRALARAGIKTIVVGIPGTEAYADTLNALAAESGVENPSAPPAYFAVSAKSGAAGLTDTLTRITTGLVTSCRLLLEEVPPVLNDVYVVIDGVQVERGGDDGWVYDHDVSPPAVVIQGATCDKLETDGAEYINITYGCPDFRPPVK